MAVSYDKEQRAYAKEHKMDLCTVAAPGVTCQGPARKIKARLIADCALHTMCLKENLPFKCIEDVKLPSDVADLLEDFKLSIVRHRASGFVDLSQQDFLSVLNALRHFVAMLKNGAGDLSDDDTSGAKSNAEKQWEATAKEQLSKSGFDWKPVETMPRSGSFLIGVWEGEWRSPRRNFRVYEAIGFDSGPVWGQQYRTAEGEACEVIGWMQKPLPPKDV